MKRSIILFFVLLIMIYIASSPETQKKNIREPLNWLEDTENLTDKDSGSVIESKADSIYMDILPINSLWNKNVQYH